MLKTRITAASLRLFPDPLLLLVTVSVLPIPVNSIFLFEVHFGDKTKGKFWRVRGIQTATRRPLGLRFADTYHQIPSVHKLKYCCDGDFITGLAGWLFRVVVGLGNAHVMPSCRASFQSRETHGGTSPASGARKTKIHHVGRATTG